jgi:hypothetical protein
MKTQQNNNASDDRFNDGVFTLVAVVTLLTLIVIMAMVPVGCNAESHIRSNSNTFTPLIYGRPKGDVLPVSCLSQDGNWDVCVYFTSTRPVSNDWWLCVTNKIGCQLHLWESDGSELHSKKSYVSAAFHLAKQATMSSLFEYLRHQRSGPMLMEHLRIDPDGVSQAYEFQLGDLFPMQFDHEYLLQVTPMLYKARTNVLQVKSVNDVVTNRTLADLVEYPPLILKLLTNGNVVSLEALPKTKKP